MTNLDTMAVMTYKSGKFIFSNSYSEDEIGLLAFKAELLSDVICDFPILPRIVAKLEKDLIRQSIFGTAAIEGNPLTEDEVGAIIDKNDHTGIAEKKEQEIINLKYAYDQLSQFESEQNRLLLSENMIKDVHKVITLNIKYTSNEPGVYRNTKVQVGDSEHGGIYTPPKCLADIKTLMKEFIEWINKDELLEMSPLIRASLIHYYIGRIHPFGNGNGRTARLIEALILKASGARYFYVVLSNYYYRNIDSYYIAFRDAEKDNNNEVTPFVKFVLTGVIDSLEHIKKKITYPIRKFALRDYYTYSREKKLLTQRQFDLLILLLDRKQKVSFEKLYKDKQFEILYRDVSERTARRDLAKLKKGKYILAAEKGNYILNFRFLG